MEPQPQRIERAHPETPQIRRSTLEFFGCPSIEGDDGDGIGWETPTGEQETGALGQDPRLARPGGSDDTRSPSWVKNRRQLVGGQLSNSPILPEWLKETVLDRDSMEDGLPDPARKVNVDWAAVAHHFGVPHHDMVDGPTRERAESNSIVRPSKAQVVTSGIDRIGPDAVVKALTHKVVHDRQLPGLKPGHRFFRRVIWIIDA